MILQNNVFPPNFRIISANNRRIRECTSEAGSSRISGVGSRVSGTAKTFVSETEGLVRTQELRPPCVDDEGSRETLSLVEEGEELGMTKEGNRNEDTVDTAMEFS